jgi:uncharacterized membrane protein YoaK (UPF0700 family)
MDMEQPKTIVYITILLAITAGYCDTVTFVSVNELFSAHVTGNFIVFAYDIIKHADTEAWLKLLSFPVFILAVITGGAIASRQVQACTLLLLQGAILTATGVICLILLMTGQQGMEWVSLVMAMCIVFAMGLQNAFGKLYGRETYGPTTMMTGNVTQAALDLGKVITAGFHDIAVRTSLIHGLVTIIGFLVGCLCGGILSKLIGLTAVLFPGLALLGYALARRKNEPAVDLNLHP